MLPGSLREAIHRRRGFTMVELLVVIVILAVLAALLLPVLARSRRQARITQCESNLKQFIQGILTYDIDVKARTENYPKRLTELYFKKYIPEPRVFLCPLDRSLGHEGGKPNVVADQFAETDEGPGKGTPACADDTPWSSYLYEFSHAQCDWWDSYLEYYDPETDTFDTPTVTGPFPKNGMVIDTDVDDSVGYVSWQEAKFYQMTYGDDNLHFTENWKGGYPESWFPVVRCFWHTTDADSDTKLREIDNVANDGNIFQSGPMWEETAIEKLDKDN